MITSSSKQHLIKIVQLITQKNTQNVGIYYESFESL